MSTPESLLRAKLLAAALAAKTPMAAPDPTSASLDDLDGAAQAFYQHIDPTNANETAGALFRDPAGKFSYSIPVPGVAGKTDKFAMGVPSSKEHALAALFHSHPGDEQSSQYFSSDDVSMADKLKIPSYVYFQKSGEIRKYIPGQTSKMSLPDHMNWGMISNGDKLAKALLNSKNQQSTAMAQQPLDIGEGK